MVRAVNILVTYFAFFNKPLAIGGELLHTEVKVIVVLQEMH